jgi:hypothetical protein
MLKTSMGNTVKKEERKYLLKEKRVLAIPGLILITVIMLSILSGIVLAEPDFDLIWDPSRHKRDVGSWAESRPRVITVRNGEVQGYQADEENEFWGVYFTVVGKYDPLKKIISGTFQVELRAKSTTSHPHKLVAIHRGIFYSSPIGTDGEVIIYLTDITQEQYYIIVKDAQGKQQGKWLDTPQTHKVPDVTLRGYKVKWLSPQPQEEQGCVDSGFRFSGLSGEVEIWHADEERDDARVAKLDMVICAYDHIWTGERSSAILSDVDMTTFLS